MYYKVKDVNKGYEETFSESVVRSCSVGKCDSRNDFVNCSHDQMEISGCTQRFCCSDTDLCNSTSKVNVNLLPLVILCFLFISIFSNINKIMTNFL